MLIDRLYRSLLTLLELRNGYSVMIGFPISSTTGTLKIYRMDEQPPGQIDWVATIATENRSTPNPPLPFSSYPMCSIPDGWDGPLSTQERIQLRLYVN